MPVWAGGSCGNEHGNFLGYEGGTVSGSSETSTRPRIDLRDESGEVILSLGEYLARYVPEDQYDKVDDLIELYIAAETAGTQEAFDEALAEFNADLGDIWATQQQQLESESEASREGDRATTRRLLSEAGVPEEQQDIVLALLEQVLAAATQTEWDAALLAYQEQFRQTVVEAGRAPTPSPEPEDPGEVIGTPADAPPPDDLVRQQQAQQSTDDQLIAVGNRPRNLGRSAAAGEGAVRRACREHGGLFGAVASEHPPEICGPCRNTGNRRCHPGL